MTSESRHRVNPSLRVRFLLTILVGLVLPLVLVGLWLTSTLRRSGEDLLRSQLAATLRQLATEAEQRWVYRQSDILLLAGNDPVRNALALPARGLPDPAVVRYVEGLFGEIADAVAIAVYRDASGNARWIIGPDADGSPRMEPAREFQSSLAEMAGLPFVVQIHDAAGRAIGAMEARIRLSSIFPTGVEYRHLPGAQLMILDPKTRSPLTPFFAIPNTPGRFTYEDSEWLLVQHTTTAPPAILAMAAPVAPFTVPFERDARTGLVALFLVVLAGFALAAVLTKRLTHSLERLAGAADAVARGDLAATIDVRGADEIGRVARAFNTMTASLQRTLHELSQRQALAAIGEFASSLAHEVRNPLTSIRLDLQRVQERLPDDERVQAALQRAIGSVDRLNHIVTGTLKVARSGQVAAEPVGLQAVLASAAHRAGPELIAHDVHLRERSDDTTLKVAGDSGALEQLFLNLLINAAQAMPDGGQVEISTRRENGTAAVTIRDSGAGMSEAELARAFDPFFSTKREGTGLGLAIVDRIARAHGGSVQLQSQAGQGTQVSVRLPLLQAGRMPGTAELDAP